MCVLTCTLVVARWMSAPAWTSRSTTSVWPFWLAAYTGLRPSCTQVKYDTGKRYLCCTNAPSNHTNCIDQFIPPTTCCHVRFAMYNCTIPYQEINEKPLCRSWGRMCTHTNFTYSSNNFEPQIKKMKSTKVQNPRHTSCIEPIMSGYWPRPVV